VVSGVFAAMAILWWLWRDTARPPSVAAKDVGLGLTLPTYASGPDSVGWWAMWITMLGDATAFASIVFGFFFYWTAQPDFPPAGATHATGSWVALAAAGYAAAWALTRLARHWNGTGRVAAARGALALAPALTAAAMAAMVASVLALQPASHVYPATIAAIVIWITVHAGLGIVMQLYCLAGSLAGKLTPRYDADLHNVTLFWHFFVLSALVGCAVIGLAPRLLP
jgi:cytochrome c oxidase subunit 1/cytochrome c oxidase subunit I+III